MFTFEKTYKLGDTVDFGPYQGLAIEHLIVVDPQYLRTHFTLDDLVIEELEMAQ